MNINGMVRIKPTAEGLDLLAKSGYLFVPGATGGVEMPLWELMHIFGPVMYMGTTVLCFEKNEVEFLGLPT